MEWNVFYHSINSQKIVTFNVFDHISFSEDVDKLLTKRCDKENFDKELRRVVMYYFWSRSEYELIIAPWCGGKQESEIKVDIFTQLSLNWDRFVDYVWSFKAEEFKKVKRGKK